MPKGYWIAHVDVHDEEAYKPYAAANPAIFKKFGGRFVVRAGKFECPEGTSRIAQRGDRISGLRRGARLLPLAGIPGQHQGAATALDRRYRHHRGLRRRRSRQQSIARRRLLRGRAQGLLDRARAT